VPVIPAPPVVINEVFYDAAGTDGGFEFVELLNRSDGPLSLAGYRLEAGDGAAADRWRALWTGTSTDVIPPWPSICGCWRRRRRASVRSGA